MKNLQKFYNEVEKFNEIAGNLDNVTVDSIDNQISYVWEELVETITAFEESDSVEVLDGAADLFVTVAGLMQKLEKAGYNVEEAVKRVCDNNLSKFPAEDEYDAEVVYHACQNEYKATLNAKHKVWVYTDSSGKVRKPSNFVSVDLSDLVPKHAIN